MRIEKVTHLRNAELNAFSPTYTFLSLTGKDVLTIGNKKWSRIMGQKLNSDANNKQKL